MAGHSKKEVDMGWGYRQSITCSHCYREGHNVKGCPKFREYAKEHPDSWAADKVKYWNNADERRKKTVRRCSYCEEPGHNKKSCKQIKRDKWNWQVKNADFRRQFKEDCLKHGIAVGALFSKKHQLNLISEETALPYTKEVELLYTLERVAWDQVLVGNRYGAIFHLELQNFPGLRYEKNKSSSNIETLLEQMKLEGSMSKEFVEEYFTTDPTWHDGTSGMPERFS